MRKFSYLIAFEHCVILLHSEWEIERARTGTLEHYPFGVVLSWLVLNL